MTPKEYLENSLNGIQGDTEEILAKNKVSIFILNQIKF